MLETFSQNALALLLLGSLHCIGGGFVSSRELSCSEIAKLVVVGTKVVRGKDWEWDNQDGGPGTQGTVLADLSDEGWRRVRWDGGGSNSYRMGYAGKCDLKIFDQLPTTTTTARPESTTSIAPASPETCHQCMCTKEMTALYLRKAKAEAESAELAKTAAMLAVEAAKSHAEAEELWLRNTAEELQFERQRREQNDV